MKRTKLPLFQLGVPIKEIPPAIMQIVRWKGAAVFLKLRVSGPPRQALWIHAALLGQKSAFPGVAYAAGCDDVFPSCAPAFAAGNHMVEGQIGGGLALVTILAPEFVAQKNIKPCEGGVFRRQHVLFQRDYRRQLHAQRRRMDGAVVF